MSQIDRLAIMRRPAGPPIMYQSWGKLLFMHWPIASDLLRPLIPERLAIDMHEGSAWLSITPFTMWGVRASFLPALPGLRAAHELNVRTYVHMDGVPGVWFLSLDISHPLMALGARLSFHLPYYRARISLTQDDGDRIDYRATRAHPGAPPAELETVWRIGGPIPRAEPGSLEFFLTERYCLYAARGRRLYRARIFHPRWTLRTATIETSMSTMAESHGLPTPPLPPRLQYAERIRVAVWPPRRVA